MLCLIMRTVTGLSLSKNLCNIFLWFLIYLFFFLYLFEDVCMFQILWGRLQVSVSARGPINPKGQNVCVCVILTGGVSLHLDHTLCVASYLSGVERADSHRHLHWCTRHFSAPPTTWGQPMRKHGLKNRHKHTEQNPNHIAQRVSSLLLSILVSFCWSFSRVSTVFIVVLISIFSMDLQAAQTTFPPLSQHSSLHFTSRVFTHSRSFLSLLFFFQSSVFHSPVILFSFPSLLCPLPYSFHIVLTAYFSPRP